MKVVACQARAGVVRVVGRQGDGGGGPLEIERAQDALEAELLGGVRVGRLEIRVVPQRFERPGGLVALAALQSLGRFHQVKRGIAVCRLRLRHSGSAQAGDQSARRDQLSHKTPKRTHNSPTRKSVNKGVTESTATGKPETAPA